MKTEIKEYIALFFGVIGTFFAPAMGIICALIFVAIIDHIFGVWKAVKKKEKVSLWVGIWTTAVKAVLYSALLLAVFAIDRTAVNDLITAIAGKPEINYLFTKGAALVLFSIEIYSINRNYKEVKGQSLFTALMGALGKAKKVANEVGKIKSGAAIMLIAVLSFYGCRSGEQLYNAAVKKGVKCEPVKEIVTEVKLDTIYREVKIGGETVKVMEVIRTVLKTDTIYRENRVKIPMSRQERKAYRDSLDHERDKFKTMVKAFERVEKQREKEAGKTDREAIRNEEPTFKEVAVNAFKYMVIFVFIAALFWVVYKIWTLWDGKK